MKVNIVIGCPGAGKTTFLTRTASQLPPDKTVMLTFSRAAAKNMLKKVGRDGCDIRTIHSLCYRNLGIQRDQVMNDKQVVDFCRRIGINPPNDKEDIYEPVTHPWEVYQYSRMTGISHIEAYSRYDGFVGVSFVEYLSFAKSLAKYKEAYGLYEFSDMLEEFRPVKSPDYLLIDEAQDNSMALTRAIEKIVELGVKELWLVGDPMQSIFTYSGADPKNMHYFGGKETYLDQSYRCAPAIVEKALSIFPDAKFKPTGEGGIVSHETFIPDSADVVLVRTNHEGRQVMKKTDLPANKVMTFHKAKGLEFEHVTIYNSTTGRVRKSMEIDPEAEKRLMFTGITRAKRRLTIVEGNHGNSII